jgi:hypothetical protein
MAELADAADSKSAGSNSMGVRFPLPAPSLALYFQRLKAINGRLWRPIARRPGTNMGTAPISLILNELLDPYRFCLRLD